MNGDQKYKYNVALVLGGGSARGLEHIGALKVFEREKIHVDLIVGTSIGALVGAAYSLGIPMKTAQEKARRLTWREMIDITIPKMGLIGGYKLEAIIADAVENKGFGDLKIPLAVVTTDIENAQEVVHTSGNLIKLIKASCSLVGIVSPLRLDGKLLVDGGYKNTVPVSIARHLGARFIIAIDVGFCIRKSPITNIFQLMFQAYQIMGEELNRFQTIPSDIVIRPALGEMDQAAFNRADFAIEKGEQAASAALPELLQKLKSL